MQHQISFKESSDGSTPNRDCCELGSEEQDEEVEEMSQMCRRLNVLCGFLSKKACGIFQISEHVFDLYNLIQRAG